MNKIKTGWEELDKVLEKNEESIIKFQLSNQGSVAVLKIYVNDILQIVSTTSTTSVDVLSFHISKESKKKGFPLKLDSLEFNLGVAKVKFKPKDK